MMFATYIDDVRYEVMDPKQYTGNCLYGRMGMHLVDEIPTENLMSVIEVPLLIGELSIRRTNKHLIIACLAVVRWDYLLNEIPLITEETLDKIILTGVKLLRKDLPLRKDALVSLYSKAVIESGIDL